MTDSVQTHELDFVPALPRRFECHPEELQRMKESQEEERQSLNDLDSGSYL